MYQKFFTNTCASKFIKALIYNTPLPILPTVSDGDYIVKGMQYVYRHSIIKCVRSGILFNDATEDIVVNNSLVASNKVLAGTGQVAGDYEPVSVFIFGNEDVQNTEHYMSRYSYYDSKTHTKLGTYLRCLRDIYSIDLMPFYNCFAYETVSDMTLSTTSDYGYVLQQSDAVKVLSIPIKFNKKYTIAIDNATPVLMKSVIYGPHGMLKNSLNDAYYTDQLFECGNPALKVVSNASLNFRRPIVYEFTNTYEDAKKRLALLGHTNATDAQITENLQQYQLMEKHLRLLIQLPVANNSSIAVLEGDYVTNHNLYAKMIMQDTRIDTNDDRKINTMPLSDLGLLQFNSRSIYAFSDRLLEYLLLNVVDYQDEITQNINRVQDYMEMTGVARNTFDVEMRRQLYLKYMRDENTRKIDITGFVDKDMEKFVTRGYDV